MITRIEKTIITRMSEQEAENIYGILADIETKNEVMEIDRKEYVEQLRTQLKR